MKRDEQTYAIIGTAMEVHKTLGHGFLEAVYQEALASQLTLRSVPFKQEVDMPISYKGDRLNIVYRADFVCYGEIIIELKALDALTGREQAQVINYLKASGLNRALLFNFGAPSLQYERLVFNYSDSLRKSVKSAEELV